MIQTYRDAAGGRRRSAREFIPYNLTLEAFKATYAEPMPPVEAEGLEPQGDNDCQAPLFKKARGRPQTARLTVGEQRARQAAWNGPGALQNIPDRVQRCTLWSRGSQCSPLSIHSGWLLDQYCCTRTGAVERPGWSGRVGFTVELLRGGAQGGAVGDGSWVCSG